MTRKTKDKDHKVVNLKVVPHSIEAEQSVLGGLMLDNNSWDKVSELLSEDDFYRPNHKLIFRVMQELGRRNQPFDVITLTESLKSISELESSGGEIYLFELAKNIPTVANIAAYAEIVRERSVLRQLIEVSGAITETAFNPEGRDTKEILDNAESKIFKIAEQRSRSQGPVDIASILTKTTERIDYLYHSSVWQ